MENANWKEYIESTPAILRGKPCFKGTRIPVSLILGYLAEGYSPEQIKQEYPDIEAVHIRASLLFARDLSEFELSA